MAKKSTHRRNIVARIPLVSEHESKPIHTPGAIQPHGVLLALNSQLEILQVSKNTQDYLGMSPQKLLGQHLSILFDSQQVEAIGRILGEAGSVDLLKLSIATPKGDRYFDGIAHQTEGAAILELEPTEPNRETRFLSFYASARSVIAKMRQLISLSEFLDLVAKEIRKMTGFDRVMVYQFDEQGAGRVFAEAKREDLPPYLGLHYPATDVPEDAKELYTRCLLRVIPDINASPVELIPVGDSLTARPLDLSYSILRKVDPCLVEYLQNMGVAATLVISLIKDRKLWGLIACHHQTPKYVPYELRATCEFLGQFIGLELANFAEREESDYIVKLKSLSSEFVDSISQAGNFKEALINPEPRLLELVSADGAAVYLDDEIALVGKTPTVEEIRSLIEWADLQIEENLFHTNSLPKLYPKAEAFKNTASGLLLLRISQIRRYYVLWFRREVIQTVNWAGDPMGSIRVEEDGGVTLSPRRSFEQWQETVRLTSCSWKACELDSAITLRNAIVGIVLSKADELAKINLELERSNRELASFAYAASHDLKEPLRGIYNYSTILLEDYAQVLDEEGLDCLQTVIGLSQRMETLINALLRLSQLGQAELNLQATDLNQLLAQTIEVLQASRQDSELDIRLPRPLPTIQCDSVLVNEVFTNLIGNALKYNKHADRWVEIGYLNPQEQLENGLQPVQTPVLYIRDNGIGIQAHHQEIIFKLFKRLHSQEKYGGGAGAGLAIAKKIIERHGGRIWVDSAYERGSTFYFTLESGSLS